MRVCLTGATGLLGSHVLQELLRAVGARGAAPPLALEVVCPVRSTSAAHAAQRLAAVPLLRRCSAAAAALQFDSAPSPEQRGEPVAMPPNRRNAAAAKVHAVPCDLASAGAVDGLLAASGGAGSSRGFDCVIHCAALDGYRHPPDLLHTANVVATRNIVALHNRSASPCPLLLHMSSCAARLVADDDIGGTATDGFLTHYARSKRAAAAEVDGGVARGVAAICDIGYLFADSLDWDDTNVVEMVWALCCRMGVAVELGGAGRIDMTHASDAARVLASLALGQTDDRVGARISGVRRVSMVNLQRPDPFDWDAVAVPALRRHLALRATGRSSALPAHSLELSLPFAEWRPRMVEYCERRPGARWLQKLLGPAATEQACRMFSPGDVLPAGGRVLTADAVALRLQKLQVTSVVG